MTKNKAAQRTEDQSKQLDLDDKPRNRLPKTGIRINAIWLVECEFKDYGFLRLVADSDNIDEAVDEEGAIQVDPLADVWLSEDNEAIVRLRVSIRPITQPTFSALVSYAAHYSADESTVVPLKDFVWANGIANLVPYVREKLASLTHASNYPVYYLPPLNIAALRQAELQDHSAEALGSE